MFKKLKLKLTISNAIILGIFLIIVTSMYMYMSNKSFMYWTNNELKGSAAEVTDLYKIPASSFVDFEEHKDNGKRRGPREYVKYILRDDNLKVTAISQEYKALEPLAIEMADRALRDEIAFAEQVEPEDEKVLIYSLPYNKGEQKGVVQTYVSLNLKHIIFSHMGRMHLIFILCGIVLAALVSWITAGRALIPVKKAWRTQKDFVADASHELRTPLTVIQTNLEVALANPEGSIKDNSQWLDNAYTETKKMGKLINDLLLLAQIDAQQIETQIASFNLSDLAEEVSRQMLPLFKNEDLQFMDYIQQDIEFEGDEMRIRQLILILLDNAIKYTPKGGQINLIIKKQDKIKIIVSDSGMGIEREKQKKIFDRFYRVDKARARSQGGTGLGLSIARWIVDMHGGKILLESEPSKGSKFTIEL